MKGLIDGHVHLEALSDLPGALERANRIGIEAIIGVGSDFESNKWLLDFSVSVKELSVLPALGVHPWKWSSPFLDETISFIDANMHRAVGVGEVGLDFWLKGTRKNPEAREKQMMVFRTMAGIAEKHGKPVIVHVRGAFREALDILLVKRVKKAVFHWYSGPGDILREILENGYFISATPAAEYSEKHREVVAKTPLSRLLVETDSPVRFGDRVSEPADLINTIGAISRITGIDEDTIARETSENTMRFYGLSNADASSHKIIIKQGQEFS